MLTNKAAGVLLLVAFGFAQWQTVAIASDQTDVIDFIRLDNEPIRPLLPVKNIDAAKARLGEALFNDRHLSADNQLSCADCHQLQYGGDDNISVRKTRPGNAASVNAPTVFNAIYNFRQGWSGSAETLAKQIERVIHSRTEANTDWHTLLQDISSQPELRQQFEKIYDDGITAINYLDALVEYHKTLVTPNSRFDQFLLGNNDAITAEEKAGYELFKEYGCASCHQGINIGGNLFQKFGIFYDYIGERGNITKADHGRKNITGRAADDYVFKVPSLRNVGVTAPYFHDGQVESLEKAIYIMGKTQLGRELSTDDIVLISLFLKTLTGDYQGKPLDSLPLSEVE